MAQRVAGACAMSLSIAMNHCGVLRKITGFFERHECGYWCFSRPRAISAPAAASALITASLASPFSPLSVMHALAGEARRLLGERAVLVDRIGDRAVDAARLKLARARGPHVEVLAAVAGRGVHEAGAGIVRHVIAGEQRHDELIAARDALERMRAAELREIVRRHRAHLLERRRRAPA